MTRRTGAAALAALLVALLGTAGCASIPSSSPPQVIAESVPASAPAENDDLRYDELVPRPGESPLDIVREYLRAAGSYERSHARARAYLTPAADRAWKDAAGVTLLEDSPYLNVTDDGTAVEMTAQQRGQLRPDGAYVPGRTQYPYKFSMKKIDGNWRIDNPPGTLFVEASTFETAYRGYAVYFLDSTRTRVVPDLRWFAAARDTLPSLLMNALERGPSQLLADGVLSDLDGVAVQSNVELTSDRVRVFLTGLDDDSATLTAGGFAQVVWTLNQVGVGGVELYSDGRLLRPQDAPTRSLQQLADWRAFSPDGPFLSAGYFVRGGAVWTTKDAPVAGPAGRGSFGARSVAVSTDERAMAVVAAGSRGRQVLYVGTLGGPLRLTVSGASLARPTWGGSSGEVWTVADGGEVLLVPRNGEAARVDLPGSKELGTIRALRLSRDGARVAVVAGPAGREQLWVGVVIRRNGSARIDNLRQLDVAGNPVSDVSWADSLSVVALVRNGQPESGLYTVDVSGMEPSQLISRAGLPAPPTAVAAGPSLPLLTVAARTLWQAPDETWSRATDEAGPESAPTYPG